MRPPTSPGPASPMKRRLVEANLPYVRAIAAHVKERLPREIEFDDLVAYGTEGLLDAAERFDGKHGASFTTFAYYRVRGAIFDGLRRMGWLPRGEWARARVDERAGEYLADRAEREAGRRRFDDAGDGDVEDRVRELADALGGLAAIFVASLTARDEEQLVDPAPQAPERIERHEAEHAVKGALSRLPAKERRLVELYYFEDKTLEEVGAVLGLSKSWTSRLHARAIDLLQSALALPPATADAWGASLPAAPAAIPVGEAATGGAPRAGPYDGPREGEGAPPPTAAPPRRRRAGSR